jgi:FAD/FMN-containing dehydrogenase/Fe-S oxidoreductase
MFNIWSMKDNGSNNIIDSLKSSVDAEVFNDNTHRLLYATDASAYREVPLAVCIPKNKTEIKQIIKFAGENKISIIPRAAGTSLAGQVTGSGIVVDISKHFNQIIEINKTEKWVRVQPGVVLDELNKVLKPKNLFFGPETSTSNRCMMAGMVGNNSCGAHSILYGSTRDHTLELECILSDGSEVVFKNLNKDEFNAKIELSSLEGEIYRHIRKVLSNKENTEEIYKQYPHKEINRRNTGYALDILLDTEIFSDSTKKFNFSKLIAGSEGTLAFITEIKLNLVDLPPKNKALVCVHTHSLEEVFEANLIALKYNPGSVELMDKLVLDLTKNNISQNRNRFFVEGDPAAILIVEWARDSIEEINELAAKMTEELKASNMGYSYPIVYGNDIPKVWELRKAGLGILSNMKGDKKPVPVIEDAALRPVDLPVYMKELSGLFTKLDLQCVYYAHIGSGELHTRPVLNLKDQKDVELFYQVALETAELVKKYNGSLSGEHGDGRLRGQFIPLMLGNKIYNLLKDLKNIWDTDNIFNANKIVDTPPMNTFLRYESGSKTKNIDTLFDFSETGGFLRTAEKCNGSGDCRKSYVFGGTICPSFQATKDEKNSTRARANILREIFTNNEISKAFKEKQIYDVLDLCLLCKACKSECPSGVDVAKLKMEFLQHYYDATHTPIRAKMIGNLPKLHKFASNFTALSNLVFRNRITASVIKKLSGFHHKRKIPELSKVNLKKWAARNSESFKPASDFRKIIYLLNDEFTNFLESHTGIAAIHFFTKLGYEVRLTPIIYSGRTYLSKGLVRKAKKIANDNIIKLNNLIENGFEIIGLEPSAILSFRDEYPDLANSENKEAALKLASQTFLYDEFIMNEISAGRINKAAFSKKKKHILFHGHCQQKSLVSTKPTHKIFELLENCIFEEIPSGCCGMAGAFGYEKEHYELSQKIGELVLFPTVRDADKDTIIAATGTSCRCQISEGTGVNVMHPIEILNEGMRIFD